MGINSYNYDELKFSKLLNDLKELPKIKAEENFEYNLMMRIQNGNFGRRLEEEKPVYSIIKFVVPSAIVSIIILIVLLLPSAEQNIDNPLMVDPPKISENEIVNNSQIFSSNAARTKKTQSKISNEKTTGQTNPELKNITSVPPKYPINQNRSVSLDEYISGETTQENNIKSGTVVRSGDDILFDAFLMPEELDKKALEKYRKMIDSIKRSEAKRDSIKRLK